MRGSGHVVAGFSPRSDSLTRAKARDYTNPVTYIIFAILEYFIYFYRNSHFFQGDTIYYFYLRHRSVGDFLLNFFQLDPAGWYRPLAARTIQSAFYPLFGLEPAGYRIVQYVLFLGALFVTYKLAFIVTRRRLAGIIAVFFFGVHTVNAYITYDVAFAPEIIYTLFYVCTVIAYLGRRLGLSIAFFLATLASKEPAVTLPFMLVALDVILNRATIWAALKQARMHLGILVIYVALVWGYLGVQRPAFQSIVKRPGPEVSYRFALDRTIVENIHTATTWAFNIPRGWQTESRHLQGWSITFLRLFRAVVLILALWLMFRPERRFVLAGFAWFFIAVGPALPLFEHFMPHYLFLPLVGFSIAIGVIADAAYRKAGITVAVPLIVLAGICAIAARNDARDNRILGWSSRLAFNSLGDLKAQHPALQPNTTIYFSDADEPDLSWDTSQGQLFKMEYNDETIRTRYWGWGEVITKDALERGPVIVMKVSQFHFKDVTQEFLASSETPVGYRASEEYRLAVEPAAAKAGGKYSLSLSPLTNSDVTLHYTLNGGPVHAFAAHLDDRSRASFDISDHTEKGLYKFVGFRKPGTDDWFQLAGSIRIE